MKTAVIMRRKFLGGEVSQNSKTGYFSATDLIENGNNWRKENNLPRFNQATFFQNKSTKDFMEYLSDELKANPKINSKGKNSHTWVHPYLFIDMALAINPRLKIKVYEWIYDELIKYRNYSGDSYKKMVGAIQLLLTNQSNFRETVIKTATKIKIECNVKDWQEATEKQLKLRDKIHEYFSLLSDILRDVDNCLDVAIMKAKKEVA